MTRQDGWRTGCYLVEFTPATPRARTDFGTLRVEAVGHGFRTSADLYHAVASPHRHSPRPRARFHPGQGIPQFPLRNYRFYLRGDSFPAPVPEASPSSEPPSLDWAFTVFEFAPAEAEGPFIQRQQYLARLRPTPRSSPRARGSTPSPRELRGAVTNQNGEVVGEVVARWRTAALRGVAIEMLSLDGAPLLPAGRKETGGLDWNTLFAAQHLHGPITVQRARTPRRRAPDRKRPWLLATLGDRVLMPRRRGAPAPALPHLRCFCVHSLEADLPGVAINHAALETNGESSPRLTLVLPTGGSRRALVRPTMEALGWALGVRPEIDPFAPQSPRGMGEPRRATLPPRPGMPCPWPRTLGASAGHELRHAPEIVLRTPGALRPHGQLQVRHLLGFPPRTTGALDEVTLTLAPIEDNVPLGAPVRVQWTLRNLGDLAVQLPACLEFSSGHLSGEVRGIFPAGRSRGFRPWMLVGTDVAPRLLPPGEATTGQVVLLRGPAGVLFPRPGRWEIQLVMEWRRGIRLVRFEACAPVTIRRPASAADDRLARRLLAEPELQPALELPGRRWTAAQRCLAAVARQPGALRDAYAAVGAWRGQDFFRSFTPPTPTPEH